MEWTAHLNLKMEKLNRNFPHCPPQRLHSLYHYKRLFFPFQFQVAPLLLRQVILFQKKVLYIKFITSILMRFASFSSLIFLTFFVFIFYKALIMKIHSFLVIRNWRENYLIKYLHNRNNHSFHRSIMTWVLIT